MNNENGTDDTKRSDKSSERISVFSNHNSKIDIQANNYNKSKVFDIKSQNLSVDLSRVDSQNYPDSTENLDFIANKMGLNQRNNNKPDIHCTVPLTEEQSPRSVCKPTEGLVEFTENTKQEIGPNTPHEPHKKSNFMAKILRRLSKPRMFSKEKKSKTMTEKANTKSNDVRTSMSPGNKSSTVCGNVNYVTPRSNSFRKILNRFGKKKTKNNTLSEPPSSIGSRPSIHTMGNVDCLGSCNDVFIDKLCREELEKYNSSSADCILDQRIGDLSRKKESLSSNSDDMRDHELKMNTSNNHIVSIFQHDVCDIDVNATPLQKSEIKEKLITNDEDKLGPINVNLNLTTWSADTDRSCRSAMSMHHIDSPSNVKLTLSLHGYSAYSLSASRFSSKSCMEFGPTCISPKSKVFMDNVAIFSEEETVLKSNGVVDDVHPIPQETENSCKDTPNQIEVESNETVLKMSNGIEKNSKEETLDGTDVTMRNHARPCEIQLRRSKVTSQTSIARSSLIMVAMSHNTPRSKGISNHGSTPLYNPDSPNYPGRKIGFEEECVRETEEKKNTTDRDGNHFLLIANKYENETSAKIEIVQRYLESSEADMDEDVIGELNTAIGLAKLLLSEKFVQFRGLCEQNLTDSNESGFKTLTCDLEGYLTTLEIQMTDLDKNFNTVERIRQNNWQMPTSPEQSAPSGPVKKKTKPRTPKSTPADSKRSVEARRRVAEYRKMTAANSQGATNLFIIH